MAATCLPLIFLFYVLMGIIEDSGYLPRAAFLMDGFMRWLGLDGRAAFVCEIPGASIACSWCWRLRFW